VQLTKVKASQNDWYKDEIPLQSSIKKVKDKLQITTTQVDDEGSAITFMEH
jgi:hypothetical protein